MKTKNIIISTGLAISTVLSVSGNVQAASFTTIFTPNPANPKQDIFVTRIDQTVGNKTLFVFPRNIGIATIPLLRVNRVNILANDRVTIQNSGGASTDRGDLATNPLGLSPRQQLTPGNLADEAAVAAYLGNYNLNNIIDTQDTGSFVIDVFFEDSGFISDRSKPFDEFFFYERGLNSNIVVQAIGSGGSLIGSSYIITADKWVDAGFRIDTTEINGAQSVGAWGISLKDLRVPDGQFVTGLRLQARGRIDNGPDFKVFAVSTVCCTPVPEPTTILGLGSLATFALVRRRQIRKSSSRKFS